MHNSLLEPARCLYVFIGRYGVFSCLLMSESLL